MRACNFWVSMIARMTLVACVGIPPCAVVGPRLREEADMCVVRDFWTFALLMDVLRAIDCINVRLIVLRTHSSCMSRTARTRLPAEGVVSEL